jgi:ribonucleoside-diphosphate reductase alpha chain
MIQIKKLNDTRSVYDIKVEKNENFFANDILVHNCVEILLPCVPIQHIEDGDDTDSEIALCVLSSINVGIIKKYSDLELICDSIVRSLDNIIEHQDYPVKAARKMLKRRSIGVGITNLAYFFAKRDCVYGDEKSLYLLDELMEHVQYYLLKASNNLAKEVGKCEWFDRTKYSKGILPIDTYTKEVDNIVNRPYSLDWEELRSSILKHGLRNSTLTCQMPNESSALATNSTNGMEAIRDYITAKKSKMGILRFVVPEIFKLKSKYTIAYDIPTKSLINVQAVIQKWIDQAISANHYYKYTGDEIEMGTVASDILYSYKMGINCIYYANTEDGKSDGVNFEDEDEDNVMDETCAGGACSI